MVAKALFEVAVNNQGDEASHKVRQYAVLAFDKGGSRLKIRLHNTKAFFNLPTLLVYPCNRFRIVFEIGADRIEAIVAFFLDNNSFIDIAVGFLGDFTLLSDMVCRDKPLGIVLPLPAYRGFPPEQSFSWHVQFVRCGYF